MGSARALRTAGADPDRHTCLQPEAIVSHLDITRGMTVADIGAGAGYFTLPLARRTGAAGVVFAVETNPGLVAGLRARVAGRRNIRVLETAAERTSLPDACCDRILMVNLWSELGDAAAAMREAGRILRPDGRLTIADWRKDADGTCGPPLEHRPGLGRMVNFLENDGWTVYGSSHVGQHHYVLDIGLSDESVQS
jgi:ubiquinone/menaquinone biosynthesis C-methylase UbiE